MVLKEISARRSVRHYQEKKIPAEIMHRLLEAARLAPTARNQQDFKIIVVQEKNNIEKLVEAAAPHQPFLKEAAAILVACATNPDYLMRCGQYAYPIDLGIVLDHISLQAVAEGLGSCWIGSFYEDKVKELLQIPQKVRVVQMMSLGFPAENPEPRPRKKIEELFLWEKWIK